jgi:hypothetical protein
MQHKILMIQIIYLLLFLLLDLENIQDNYLLVIMINIMNMLCCN